MHGIPDYSMIFSSCLCNRVIVIEDLISSQITDTFTICLTPFFFASLIKLKNICVSLGASDVNQKSLSTLSNALEIVSDL